MENLNKALDDIFGPNSCEEKDIIVEAVKKDSKPTTSNSEVSVILSLLNETFNKKHRVMSKKVINRYKEILKHYSIKEIESAFIKAKDDDYHIETGYKHCHPEYFSRMEQMDKWVSFEPKQKNKSKFVLPKMNT